MAFRDRFMRRLIEWQAAQGDRNRQSTEPPVFAPAARFSLLLDAIKLIGTGNGAGVLASVAALYYFASRPELHFPVKLAAVFFGVGLLVFAVSVTAFVHGLVAITGFYDDHGPFKEPSRIPSQALDHGINGLIFLALSLLGSLASWACFMIGTSIALYAIIAVG
jgi:hypothetical protein